MSRTLEFKLLRGATFAQNHKYETLVPVSLVKLFLLLENIGRSH